MAKSKSNSAGKGTKKRQRVSAHSVSTSSKSRLKYDPIGPDDNDSHPAIYRYRLTDGGDLAKALVRENVLDFFYPHVLHGGKIQKSQAQLDRLQQRRDVFLLAFQAVQQLSSTDKWSFYQIAGIHGLPYEAYDGDKGSWDASAGSSWWGGYCEHGSPLFPTWHRPYMLLVEQSIIRQAKVLAESVTDSAEKALVKDIADELRVPYWDWANDSTRIFGVPDVFTSTEISLLYTWKSFSTTPIPNPLKSFVFPKDVGVPYPSSDVFNPAAKPHYVVPPSGTPFSPKGYPTVRHVSAAYTSQNDKVNLTVMRNAGTTLVEGVHAVFHHSDWLSFSNHFWSESTHGDGTEYGHYSSLELVHDLLHGSVGGSGGQMTYPDTAAFDPIFFFHHANVDRQLALWQYCYPKSWIDDKEQDIDDGTYTIKPDTPASSNTDLTPFRRSQASDAFVSSNDVRIVDIDCGYTYPEIQMARKQKWTPGKMLQYVLELYKPPQHYVHNWYLVLEKIIKRAFNGPYCIRVFIDKADATATTSLSDPHFAGDIHVFARSNTVRCVNCDLHQNMRAALNLTKTMVRLGMTTAKEVNNVAGDAPTPNINPLSDANAIKLVFVDPRGDQLNPSSIGWDGPNRFIYYQEGVKDEEIEEVLLQQVDEDSNAQLPTKPPTKFLLSN